MKYYHLFSYSLNYKIMLAFLSVSKAICFACSIESQYPLSFILLALHSIGAINRICTPFNNSSVAAIPPLPTITTLPSKAKYVITLANVFLIF